MSIWFPPYLARIDALGLNSIVVMLHLKYWENSTNGKYPASALLSGFKPFCQIFPCFFELHLVLPAPCQSIKYNAFQGTHLTVLLGDLHLQTKSSKAATELQRQTRTVHPGSIRSRPTNDYLPFHSVLL